MKVDTRVGIDAFRAFEIGSRELDGRITDVSAGTGASIAFFTRPDGCTYKLTLSELVHLRPDSRQESTP